LQSDLSRIALASHAAEMCRRTAPEGEASPAFDRLTEILDHLLEEPASVAVRRAFELRLVSSLGYHPSLSVCALCGREEGALYFDLESGGCLCPDHGIGKERIGPGTRAWMQHVLASEAFLPHGPFEASDAAKAARTVRRPMDRFFASLLGSPLRSTAFLEDVLP
ncbi:MAG: DNA repair protein RecO, partial [Myxococcales bacterium]|nr:DNA repair protein RecO [Myxococcales bacterium]